MLSADGVVLGLISGNLSAGDGSDTHRDLKDAQEGDWLPETLVNHGEGCRVEITLAVAARLARVRPTV